MVDGNVAAELSEAHSSRRCHRVDAGVGLLHDAAVPVRSVAGCVLATNRIAARMAALLLGRLGRLASVLAQSSLSATLPGLVTDNALGSGQAAAARTHRIGAAGCTVVDGSERRVLALARFVVRAVGVFSSVRADSFVYRLRDQALHPGRHVDWVDRHAAIACHVDETTVADSWMRLRGDRDGRMGMASRTAGLPLGSRPYVAVSIRRFAEARSRRILRLVAVGPSLARNADRAVARLARDVAARWLLRMAGDYGDNDVQLDRGIRSRP